MAFAKITDEELAQMTATVLRTLKQTNQHPIPDTTGMTFSDIERLSHQVGQQIAAALTADALASAAAEAPAHAPCPTCGGGSRVTQKRRTISTLDGPVDYNEPASHCVACRRDFFPSADDAAAQ
jgi:hypothetical protein